MGFNLSDIAFSWTFEWTYGGLMVFLTFFLLVLALFIHAIIQLTNRYFSLKKKYDAGERRILSLELENLALRKEARQNKPNTVEKN